MFTFVFWGAFWVLLIAGAALAAVKFVPALKGTRVVWWQWLIATVVAIGLCPLIAWIGTSASVGAQLNGYHEYWGGVEVSVSKDVHHCYESSEQGGSTGGCERTFDADSYTYYYWVTVCTTVGSGKDAHQECHQEQRSETRWRQVPYTQEETDYVVHTTLGDYTICASCLQENPQQHRIRAEDGSQDSIANQPVGVPALWAAAQTRINAGDPGPVTAGKEYANFIYASQDKALSSYSSSIGTYQKMGVLPDIKYGVDNFYYAYNRLYVEGVSLPNMDAWQYQLNKLDGAVGAAEQGDVYLVVVNANKVTDPTDYTLALKAYWQSPHFGKYAISKNGILIVVGTKDGKTVAWADGATGMPEGNNAMLYDIRNNLTGVNLDPISLIGNPVMKPVADAKAPGGYKVNVTVGNGAIEKILFGPDKFVRVHMTNNYAYLKGEIKPSGLASFLIYFFILLLSIGAFGLLIALESNAPGGGRSSYAGSPRFRFSNLR